MDAAELGRSPDVSRAPALLPGKTAASVKAPRSEHDLQGPAPPTV